MASASSVQYCYPKADQFPVDSVCGQIVAQLEKHDWDVPGMSVEFDDTRVGSKTYRRVRVLSGEDFRIFFCRKQGFERCLGGFNDIASVSTITIPQKQITVYNDESGPTLHVYVGKDWFVDCYDFIHGNKVLSKLKGEPRTYLRYKGGFQKPEDPESRYWLRGVRAPYLVADDDHGRDYPPENDEPTYYKTDEVFQEFVSYLEEHVLKKIENKPC